MTRAQPRTHLHRSRLTRFLTENAMSSAAPAAVDVGQKLGDWLNFRQAIALHSVLNPEPQTTSHTPAYPRRAGAMTAEALGRHVHKVREQLEQSIVQGAPSGSGMARIDMPPAGLDPSLALPTAFEPYRRFYTAHQRQMDVSIQGLRALVRGQLNQSGPRLQQLAALDAAMETILSEREAVLLGTVCKLHEKRFKQTLKELHHEPKNDSDAVSADNAKAPARMDGLGPWRQDLRTALLAELDTRMQPVLGLLEAFDTYTKEEQ